MSSKSLRKWRTARSVKLDRLMQAHVIVGGSGAGRRWATEELNHAIVLRLASEFQGFSRDLHNEAVDTVAEVLSRGDGRLNEVLQLPYRAGRRLDRGNADPGTLGKDFAMLGLEFWPDLKARYPVMGERWRQSLEMLNCARNGLAHDDVKRLQSAHALGWPLTLASIRRWRNGLDGLAGGMDHVTKVHIEALWKVTPW
jgi:hypothetical protein